MDNLAYLVVSNLLGAGPCIEFATWISGRLRTLAKEGTYSFKIPIKMNPWTERG